MFICKDLSQRFFLSLYWDNNLLFVVIKQILSDGELREKDAVSYTKNAAREILEELPLSAGWFHGLEFDSLDATAIAGRIAEGLKNRKSNKPGQRIDPDMWQ